MIVHNARYPGMFRVVLLAAACFLGSPFAEHRCRARTRLTSRLATIPHSLLMQRESARFLNSGPGLCAWTSTSSWCRSP